MGIKDKINDFFHHAKDQHKFDFSTAEKHDEDHISVYCPECDYNIIMTEYSYEKKLKKAKYVSDEEKERLHFNIIVDDDNQGLVQ
jgi:hypothetical protein